MSAFSRLPTSQFGPLFRLLDDYDSHRSSTGRTSSILAFQPRFNVYEDKQSYELYGEFPGVSQKNINIEFSDPFTVVVSGNTLQGSSSDSPQGHVTGEVKDAPHKATVEDEEPKKTGEKGHKGSTDVATRSKESAVGQKQDDKREIWLAERSAGEFHRSFSFPVRVDQDGTKADMKDGVLHISIPKGSENKGRKINIS